MNGLIAEVRAAMAGCLKVLTFKEDWRDHFDVSSEGVMRSFLGIILALPAFMFTVNSANYLVASEPTMVDGDAMITVGEAVLIWARFWLVFPIVAAGTVMLLGASNRFASWLVVHNWMTFALIHFQALFWALYVAGLADARSFVAFLGTYQILRLLVHWRVALATLGISLPLSVAAAGIPLVADIIIRTLLA
jgi:hypothetical protein